MEIRQEITQIIDTLPNNVLQDVLLFVKKIEKVKVQKNKMVLNLEKILSEDAELLKKLAE